MTSLPPLLWRHYPSTMTSLSLYYDVTILHSKAHFMTFQHSTQGSWRHITTTMKWKKFLLRNYQSPSMTTLISFWRHLSSPMVISLLVIVRSPILIMICSVMRRQCWTFPLFKLYHIFFAVIEKTLCMKCKEHESNFYQKEISKIIELENKFARLWSQCQRCQGSLHQEVLCTRYRVIFLKIFIFSGYLNVTCYHGLVFSNQYILFIVWCWIIVLCWC